MLELFIEVSRSLEFLEMDKTLPLASFMETSELLWLKFSKKLQLKADIEARKFQSKQLMCKTIQ